MVINHKVVEEFSVFLWNQNIHYRGHKSPPLDLIFSQFDPIVNFTPSFLLFDISFNVFYEIRFDVPRRSLFWLLPRHAARPAKIANFITQIISDEQYKLRSHSNTTSKQNSHLLKQISATVSTYSYFLYTGIFLKEQINETVQLSNTNEAKHTLIYLGNSSNPGGQFYSSVCLDASSIFRIKTFNDLIQFQVTRHL